MRNEERTLLCCPVMDCEYTREFFPDDSDACFKVFWMHVYSIHSFSVADTDRLVEGEMNKGNLSPDDPRHGTATGYRYHKCRCKLCRDAHAKLTAMWKKGRPPLAPDDPRHGTDNGYKNYDCRCVRCREAKSEDNYKRRRNNE